MFEYRGIVVLGAFDNVRLPVTQVSYLSPSSDFHGKLITVC